MGSGEVSSARGVIKKGIVFGLVISLFSSSTYFLAVSLISSMLFGSPVYQPLLEVLTLDIFLAVFGQFLGCSLVGLQKFREMSIANSVGSSFRHIMAIILLHFNFGLLGVVLGWIIGDLSGMILYFYFLLPFRGAVTPFPLNRMMKYSLPIYLAGYVDYFSARVDQFLIILYLGLEKFGIYNAAMTASWIVSSFSDTVSVALFPQIAERFGRKDNGALRDASYGASRYLALICIPLSVGLAAVALPTITLFAGTRYIEGAVPLASFSLSCAVGCFGVIASSIISSQGNTRVFLWSSFLSFVIDSVLCLMLIPRFGIIGASFGKTFASIASFVFVLYNLKKSFGWNFDMEALKKSWISAGFMGLVVLAAQYFFFDKFYLPLYILLGGLAYFASIRMLRLVTTSDMDLARRFLPKKLEFIVGILTRLLVARAE
jgi:O-antigen/teichoic acid export membrane protein